MLIAGHQPMLPIYPLIAQQIYDDYGQDQGICIDIGTGPGYLGIELAKITSLDMYFVDLNPEALDKAREAASCVDNKLTFMVADVTSLPFADSFADLVISRGSLWFWKDQKKGLQEIYRILKPGRVALVGGGLGRYTPASMRQRLKGKTRRAQQKKGETGFLDGAGLNRLISAAGLSGCRVVSDVEGEDGTWIEMKKPGLS